MQNSVLSQPYPAHTYLHYLDDVAATAAAHALSDVPSGTPLHPSVQHERLLAHLEQSGMRAALHRALDAQRITWGLNSAAPFDWALLGLAPDADNNYWEHVPAAMPRAVTSKADRPLALLQRLCKGHPTLISWQVWMPNRTCLVLACQRDEQPCAWVASATSRWLPIATANYAVQRALASRWEEDESDRIMLGGLLPAFPWACNTDELLDVDSDTFAVMLQTANAFQQPAVEAFFDLAMNARWEAR